VLLTLGNTDLHFERFAELRIVGCFKCVYHCCIYYSIVYILCAACSPVFGFIIDKVGYNVCWVVVALVATLVSHILLGFTFVNPWVPMVSVTPVGCWAEIIMALRPFIGSSWNSRLTK